MYVHESLCVLRTFTSQGLAVFQLHTRALNSGSAPGGRPGRAPEGPLRAAGVETIAIYPRIYASKPSNMPFNLFLATANRKKSLKNNKILQQ